MREQPMKKSYSLLALLLSLSVSATAQTISWEPVNNHLYGMTVLCLGVAQNGDLYVGDKKGVMYRSTDRGQNWQRIISPTNKVIDNIIGLSSGRILISASGELYFSVNDGETWEFVDDPSASIDILKFIPDEQDHLFGATEEGVLYSEDEGNTWIKRNEGLTDTTVQDLMMNTSGDLFAATPSGIFRSVNQGESWSAINTGLTSTDIINLAVDSSGILFAKSAYGYLFASSDNGNHWEYKTQSLSGSQGALLADSNNILYASVEKGISRSSDLGSTWEGVNGMINPFVHFMKITPDFMAVGTEGGIFFSTDGENWQASNTGLQETEITALIENDGGMLFAGSVSGVFRSADAGDTWKEINSGLTNILINDLVLDDDGNLFAATDGEGLWRSPDNGDSWEQAGIELQNQGIEHLAFSSDSGLFSTSNREIFLSEDHGQSWETIVEYGTFTGAIQVFALNDSGALFVGTRDGIFISKDTGKSWEQKIEGMTNTNVRSIHFTSQGTVLVGVFSGNGYRSTNQGESWESLNSSETISLLCFTETERAYIYAGSNGRGIFQSKNDGITWEYCRQGLLNKYVDAILAHSDGHIFAGTRGSGVYRSIETPDVGVNETALNVPASMMLEQNYPNPFNPDTEITFRLGESTHVSLVIVDSNGRSIRNLLSGMMHTGEHRISWNGKNDSGDAAASGVYICRLESGSPGKPSQLVVRKMLLLR